MREGKAIYHQRTLSNHGGGNMSQITPDVIVDTKGMICPMPVLRAKKAIDSLQSGQVLGLLSIDAGTESDILLLVERLGLELLETNENSGVVEFFIRKK